MSFYIHLAILEKAQAVIPTAQLWVNPDCGLKTRNWLETKSALKNLVESARKMRESVLEEV